MASSESDGQNSLLSERRRRRAEWIESNRAKRPKSNDSSTAGAPGTQQERFQVETFNVQEQSPFLQLPGEVRDKICAYVLAEYEDHTHAYQTGTYFTRPGYSAIRRTDTALLRTCKQAYFEADFRVWTEMEHTFWLGSNERRPEPHTTMAQFVTTLQSVQRRHEKVEIDHVRFFAQLWALQTVDHLTPYLDVPSFNPRNITITLRHTDWWYWEQDQYLYIESAFVTNCKFPASLKRLTMELECVERRKEQLDSVAEQMRRQWHFTRKDSVCLFADGNPITIAKWQGPSIIAGNRWIRDETEPEKINFHIATLTWTAESARSTEGRNIPPRIDTLVKPTRPNMNFPVSLRVGELLRHGIPRGLPAEETFALLNTARSQPRQRNWCGTGRRQEAERRHAEQQAQMAAQHAIQQAIDNSCA